MTTLTAIQNRFDALAAEALENLITDVEKRHPVRATTLIVEFVPDQRNPTVDVNLTVVPVKSHALPRLSRP